MTTDRPGALCTEPGCFRTARYEDGRCGPCWYTAQFAEPAAPPAPKPLPPPAPTLPPGRYFQAPD